ncbi:hypothetical protein [Streptosporangium sp. KLBMP 9127]|nr:hypothetical protein [Streptosporangium sp. KLBMP 9127]
MRRLIAVVAAALVAPALATATPASAQTAAGPNPADALKKQFKNDHGLRFTESVKTSLDGDVYITNLLKGTYEFGKSGIAAADVTSRAKLSDEFLDALEEREDDEETESLRQTVKMLTTPMRIIALKGVTYLSSPVFTEQLPAGKTWVSSKGAAAMNPARISNQSVNVFEPRTLKGLLADAARKTNGGTVDGAKTTLYQGTITYAELYKLSPAFRGQHINKLSAKAGKTKLAWQLWLDSKDLPRRVVTTISEKSDGMLSAVRTDTRLSGWGVKVDLKAPAADLVADQDDLDEELPEIPELPFISTPAKILTSAK